MFFSNVFIVGEEIKDKKIHSYSWNKSDHSEYLCQDFPKIELSWKTKYGFFTLGWKVEIYNVSAKCGKGPHCINFANQTYNKENNRYEEVRDCCDHVIVYYVHEGNGKCNDKEINRKEKINKIIQEIKAAEEKLKVKKEEIEKLEKEEKMMREKEEREMKERENRQRNEQQIENRKMREIINQQEKENNELNRKVNIDTSWIDIQMIQMITSAEITYSENTNFNAQKEINANYKIVKS